MAGQLFWDIRAVARDNKLVGYQNTQHQRQDGMSAWTKTCLLKRPTCMSSKGRTKCSLDENIESLRGVHAQLD